MTEPAVPAPSRPGLDVAAIVIAIVGLQQGLVPLGLRLVTGHQERFALASHLPSPWWWITCMSVMVAAATLFTIVDTARTRRGVPAAPAAGPDDRETGSRSAAASPSVGPTTSDQHADAGSATDAVSGLVFLVGMYNGVLPFAARLIDTRLFLSLPTRLPSPWWWIVSLAVCVATAVALGWLERTRSRWSSSD